MSRLTMSHEHKTWQDWLVMVLAGVFIISLAFEPSSIQTWMMLNTIAVGFLILTFAISEFELPERSIERITFALGLWAFVSPFVFGYFGSGMLWMLHMVIGAAVMVMSWLELQQDHTA